MDVHKSNFCGDSTALPEHVVTGDVPLPVVVVK